MVETGSIGAHERLTFESALVEHKLDTAWVRSSRPAQCAEEVEARRRRNPSHSWTLTAGRGVRVYGLLSNDVRFFRLYMMRLLRSNHRITGPGAPA